MIRGLYFLNECFLNEFNLVVNLLIKSECVFKYLGLHIFLE